MFFFFSEFLMVNCLYYEECSYNMYVMYLIFLEMLYVLFWEKLINLNRYVWGGFWVLVFNL